MDDGIPRIANTLPRREKVTFALRKADWPASTSLCETLPATASTWLDVLRGKLRAAECHIPRGSRETPKRCGRTKWNKPRSPRKQHTTHTLPRPEKAWFEPNSSKKRGIKSGLTPWPRYASGSPRAKYLEPHPAQTGDIFAAWRRRTLILWDRWCSALIFGPRLCSASATGKSACPSFCAGFTCHITLCCCCCPPHSFEPW
ncbi:hypothetical protein TcCL_ESM08793 [Trypanosoma cruzi]|nr:hypothetical protein TcCL_ESM08793 [Trypanosoma cruzi]